MRLLLIDTAGDEGSVALADTSLAQVVVASERLPGRSSSERLVPAVRRLLLGADWMLGEMSAIVVLHGPGSFTGVRVGVSAAKGLSEAAGIPVIAVSRLAVLAGSVEENGLVYAVLDAGRGEFYVGEYEGGVCVREALLSRAELMAAASVGVVVVCQAAVAADLAALEPRVVEEPGAGAAWPMALRRMEAGAFDDVGLLDANYLRRVYAAAPASASEPR